VAIHLQKLGLLTVLLICFVSTSPGQQSPQAIFDKANEQLEAGNYQQAISLYQELEAQKTVSGALFLNLGICYQRLDSLGTAKYYFLKASQFDETRQQAKQAVEYVESQFSRQSAVLPKLPWDVATDWLQQNIGASNLMITGIALLNMGILLFIAHWFLNWYPEYFKKAGLTILVISVLMIITSLYTNYVDDRYSTAVMVTEKVPVLEQPQNEASLVSQAFEGYTFTVDHYRSESYPGWAYVRMSNGLYGWIPDNDILIL
jgi:tetratricopeptide (TPR) repeat protein